MDYDFSEYKADEYEIYQSQRESNKYIDYSYFHNKAFFRSYDNKDFRIVVDGYNEYHSMTSFFKEEAEKHPESYGARIFLSGLTDEDRKIDEEREKYNEQVKKTVSDKYDVEFEDTEETVALAVSNEPDTIIRPYTNVYSGSFINVNYGEGILDFIYADFKTPAKKLYDEAKDTEGFKNFLIQHSDVIEKAVKNSKVTMEAKKKEVKPKEIKIDSKIYDRNQIIVRDFLDYDYSFFLINEIAYASLYTAICPPRFKDTGLEASRLISGYSKYILRLQQEFRDLIEFCYDEDFYPEVLGQLLPVERFSAYKRIKELPMSLERTEIFQTGRARIGENNPPYSYDIQTFLSKLNDKPITDEHVELADKFNIDAKDLAAIISFPIGISIHYRFSSLVEILELEFTKMLEKNIRFRKCKRCGKYFIMKGNYDTNYCDRIEPGTTRTCKDLAAQENYKKKTEGNEAIALYQKYYKRYAARVKVRQIKEPDFKKWKYEAIVKRDDCTDGIISVAEYKEWLESCFPNRKPKV